MYKGQGRNQYKLLIHAYKTFLVQEKQLQASNPTYETVLRLLQIITGGTQGIYHCRPRASQNIKGHHRPVIASTSSVFMSLVLLNDATSTTKVQLVCQDLARYWNKPDKPTHQLRTTMHHNTQNRAQKPNKAIPYMCGTGKLPRVKSN